MSSMRASISCLARSTPASSRFVPTSIGSPQRKAPRPKGSATCIRSQLRIIRRRLAAKTTGTIGTRARRATLTMPALATIAGPAGPSGVMPTQSPAASAFTIVRSAALPPRRVEPVTVCTPKCATASAMMRPSRCAEISMWIGARRCHAIGIIISRPCQKARMNGRPASRRARGCSAPSTLQRLVR